MMSFLFSAKAHDLKKDIEILSQTFERIVDRKDAILKSLVKDSEEAEEQYQIALRSHIQNIDQLIGNQRFCSRSFLIFLFQFILLYHETGKVFSFL